MYKALFLLQVTVLSIIWAIFLVPNTFAASIASTSASSNNTTVERQKAMEEVNSLIIGSYKSRLDRVLDDLYNNIEEASKGSVIVEITALKKVRNDLDDRLDNLSEESISPNRRKILTGVYFYLKSNIEWRIRTVSSTGVNKTQLK